MTIIGIDSATRPEATGLARASYAAGALVLEAVERGRRGADLSALLDGWLPASPTLLAFDAPLGWPAPLGPALAAHRAGDPLSDLSCDALFQRLTDRVVRAHAGKRPLDVGADRIARTAHVSLGLLDALRQRSGRALPLAWEAGALEGSAAIEVYPAATLALRGWPSAGYKGKSPKARPLRTELCDRLARELTVPAALRPALEDSDHALDAALCVLAGADFLRGNVLAPGPEQRERALREGWIWVVKDR